MPQASTKVPIGLVWNKSSPISCTLWCHSFQRLLRVKLSVLTCRVSIYEKNQDWGRKLMAMHKGNLSESPETFCKSDPTVSAWSATTESELTCLAVLQSRSAQKNLSDALGAHGMS